MSDIYTHEDVMDFTNPFLNYEQGYTRPFTTILPTVRATLVPIAPDGEESVLPKKCEPSGSRLDFAPSRSFEASYSEGD